MFGKGWRAGESETLRSKDLTAEGDYLTGDGLKEVSGRGTFRTCNDPGSGRAIQPQRSTSQLLVVKNPSPMQE